MTERNVQINTDQELYVIEQGENDFRLLFFDECMERIELYGIELAGRGVIDAQYIDTPARAMRGSIGAYDTMRVLEEQLIAALDEGETAVAALSPDLYGLEGHLVEATTNDGETRRFRVGLSEGPIPVHLEITNWTDKGRRPAAREYASVRDLGHYNDDTKEMQ
jgi:hypothetical protein